MGRLSGAFFVMAALLFLFAQTFNGGGPDRGFEGLFVIFVSMCFAAIGMLLGAIWFGIRIERQRKD